MDTKAKNVVSSLGGHTHYGTEIRTERHAPFPICRTGDQSNKGTTYRNTDAPVSCSNCLDIDAATTRAEQKSAEIGAAIAAGADVLADAKPSARRTLETLAALGGTTPLLTAYKAQHPKGITKTGIDNLLSLHLVRWDMEGYHLTDLGRAYLTPAAAPAAAEETITEEAVRVLDAFNAVGGTIPAAAITTPEIGVNELAAKGLIVLDGDLYNLTDDGLDHLNPATAAVEAETTDHEEDPEAMERAHFADTLAYLLRVTAYADDQTKRSTSNHLIRVTPLDADTVAITITDPIGRELSTSTTRANVDPAAIFDAFDATRRPDADGLVVRPDGRAKYTVTRDGEITGVLFDESAARMNRGRFALWSPKSKKPNGQVGFFDSADEALDALRPLLATR